MRVITISGEAVAKSGPLDLTPYLEAPIARLTGFRVTRRGAQTHSHAHDPHSHAVDSHPGHSHQITPSVVGDANAQVHALGLQKTGLTSSKAADSGPVDTGALADQVHAESSETTTEGIGTVAGLTLEDKTVIEGGAVTTTIPADNSVALSGRKEITIGNDVSDSLVGTEVVVIRALLANEMGGIL